MVSVLPLDAKVIPLIVSVPVSEERNELPLMVIDCGNVPVRLNAIPLRVRVRFLDDLNASPLIVMAKLPDAQRPFLPTTLILPERLSAQAGTPSSPAASATAAPTPRSPARRPEPMPRKRLGTLNDPTTSGPPGQARRLDRDSAPE